MASPCEIVVEAKATDEALMQAALAAAIAEVKRIETTYSRYRPDSIISRINQAAGREAVAVDAEMWGLLDFADQLWRLSEGLFDITSGVLRRVWDFRAPVPRLPRSDDIAALLPLVGWAQVQRCALPDATPTAVGSVYLPQAGMELDIGGFGKEYAVDRAAAVLAAHGLRHALVNLGGDLYALGTHGLPELAGQPWQVAIAHPRPSATATTTVNSIATLPLQQGALTTSGDYERFFEHQGQRYCHILHPHTGWPVQYWQSISVLAPTASASGALSTIAMLKGETALAWLQAQQVRYLAIQHDGAVFRR